MSAQPANRAALLTPPGEAAIAVIRLSGPGVETFIGQHLSKPPKAGRCVHCELRDADRVIDDPVIVLVDPITLDINLHGGRWVVHECMELARRHGFEPAGEIELPEASDLIEREMLAAVPLARTERALRELLEQPALWREALRTPARDLLRRMLRDESLWRLLNPPRVAIIGVPNAGKSTLANRLFGQQRSITADIPGTTRDWVGDWANLDGVAVHLLDTPGLRQSSDTIEQAAIAASDAQIEQADLVVVLLDPTQPPDPQRAILARFPGALAVVNKSDLPPRWELHDPDVVRITASTGDGIDRLIRAIHVRLKCEAQPEPLARWWTQAQRARIERAIESENPADVVVGHE